jgi:hypothetical protein
MRVILVAAAAVVSLATCSACSGGAVNSPVTVLTIRAPAVAAEHGTARHGTARVETTGEMMPRRAASRRRRKGRRDSARGRLHLRGQHRKVARHPGTPLLRPLRPGEEHGLRDDKNKCRDRNGDLADYNSVRRSYSSRRVICHGDGMSVRTPGAEFDDGTCVRKPPTMDLPLGDMIFGGGLGEGAGHGEREALPRAHHARDQRRRPLPRKDLPAHRDPRRRFRRPGRRRGPVSSSPRGTWPDRWSWPRRRTRRSPRGSRPGRCRRPGRWRCAESRHRRTGGSC